MHSKDLASPTLRAHPPFLAPFCGGGGAESVCKRADKADKTHEEH